MQLIQIFHDYFRKTDRPTNQQTNQQTNTVRQRSSQPELKNYITDSDQKINQIIQFLVINFFLQTKNDFRGSSEFYGQCSFTEPGSTLSPWIIINQFHSMEYPNPQHLKILKLNVLPTLNYWSRHACVRYPWWQTKRSWPLFSPNFFFFFFFSLCFLLFTHFWDTQEAIFFYLALIF